METALVVLVPEAEALVRPFRDNYDPSAAAGMPAHITLLYPFKPSADMGEPVLGDLRRCFARFAPFRYSLAAIRRFPTDVLYLGPEPDEPFRRLMLEIWHRYPETPPYAGKHPDTIPHLSVAQSADAQRLDRIADEFARACRGRLPIHALAADVALMEKNSGRWQLHASLGLGERSA